MKRLILTTGLTLSLVLGLGSAAQSQSLKYTYAVKFVCGEADEDAPVAPGVYYTAINIYITSKRDTSIDAEVYFTYPSSTSGSDYDDIDGSHDKNTAFLVDCEVFANLDSDSDFFEGILYIWARKPLDVMAVYTTEAETGSDSAPAIHVEYIKGRKFSRRGDAGKPVY